MRSVFRYRVESDDTILNSAGEIAEAVGWRTLRFLTALNDTIYTTCTRIIREKAGRSRRR